MILLELLRQELPKRGGWPEGVACVVQSLIDGELYFYDRRYDGNGAMLNLRRSGYKFCKASDIGRDDVTGLLTPVITREQYEATGWDGVGLPPVGCDVEYHCYPDGWVIINIVARIKGATFIEWKSGTHKGGDIIRGDFPLERVRPLRTEAERTIDEMVRLSGVSIGAAKILYDAGYRKG